MIQAVNDGDYHPVRVKARTEKLEQELSQIPPLPEIEIVPYPFLWDCIMEFLIEKTRR